VPFTDVLRKIFRRVTRKEQKLENRALPAFASKLRRAGSGWNGWILGWRLTQTPYNWTRDSARPGCCALPIRVIRVIRGDSQGKTNKRAACVTSGRGRRRFFRSTDRRAVDPTTAEASNRHSLGGSGGERRRQALGKRDLCHQPRQRF
jgi:hypothetical protein